ncbi:phage tail protein, partial [Escherichia coli]|nr:phage tail protein [Escherichia coli]
QLACAGRISFDCDCGRHQYWYRYLATMGNYCIAPPKEFAFPKIRNPELSGVACKHVLKAATMLQSLAWQRILANQMKQQARRVG